MTAVAALASLALTSQAVAALDLSRMINEAGRQRMLSQRMVKAYCQIGMQVSTDRSRRQLKLAVERFDSQLADLLAAPPDERTRKALDRVEQIWSGARPIATGSVTRENAARLMSLSEELLHASHEVVQLMQDVAGTSYARLVNVSGRQRMLSQRLAKLYMLRAWGMDTRSINDEIEVARNEFAGALASLLSAPENSDEIRAELEAVSVQWNWFESALELRGTKSYQLLVAEASESILGSMELVTQLYEAESR